MSGIDERTVLVRNIRGHMATLSAQIRGGDERVSSMERRCEARFEAVDRRFEELRLGRRIDALDLKIDAVRGHLGARIDNLLTGTHDRESAEIRERLAVLEERAGISR